MPIRQGVLNAGVSRIKVLLNLLIVHNGREIVLENEEAFVWDMGTEITLCNALLEDEGLLPAAAGPSDDVLLDALVTKEGRYDAGQGESLLLSHLQARSNYSRSGLIDPASLNAVAQLGPDLPSDLSEHPTHILEHERAIRDFADSVAQCTSQARVDNWDLGKIFEVRRLLLAQLASPDIECQRRLEEIKVRYPEVFSDKIDNPCRLKKFEI